VRPRKARQAPNATRSAPDKGSAVNAARRALAERKRQSFRVACERHGLAVPETEYRFDASRKWRFDYAWPKWKVALEVEGGVWTGGRHTTGAGFTKDMEKYNAAASQGWRVLRVTPSGLSDLATFELIRRALMC
jgi:very-short-patch-repair endonuclease